MVISSGLSLVIVRSDTSKWWQAGHRVSEYLLHTNPVVAATSTPKT
jgi:hypothetical protein